MPKTWDIGQLDTVLMNVENTVRYQLVKTGDDDWNRSLPSGGGLIHLGENQEVYSISMFHQLRCLDIIRTEFINRMASDGEATPGALTQHCMNYLRQMVLCRANLRLESCRNAHGPRISVADITHTCSDWSAVYAAAEENYQTFMNRKR
ncbi:hypothetical protein CVT25_003753 [Psilocybe cyanescens]|uniref:Uncharacterized protein n=1 Tax=Psilocybe cyanescens TaxID=93625 RepID=A0A409XTW2_PSICY|nr:hypothetical protein CVT25_003753 [Psilocybe cyanescens]